MLREWDVPPPLHLKRAHGSPRSRAESTSTIDPDPPTRTGMSSTVQDAVTKLVGTTPSP
jgi:hypothetical protein